MGGSKLTFYFLDSRPMFTGSASLNMGRIRHVAISGSKCWPVFMRMFRCDSLLYRFTFGKKNVCCLWQVPWIFLLLLYVERSSASYATVFTVGCLEHYKNWVAGSRYILIFRHCILRLLQFIPHPDVCTEPHHDIFLRVLFLNSSFSRAQWLACTQPHFKAWWLSVSCNGCGG